MTSQIPFKNWARRAFSLDTSSPSIGLFESNVLVVWALLTLFQVYLKAVKRVETADFVACKAEKFKQISAST